MSEFIKGYSVAVSTDQENPPGVDVLISNNNGTTVLTEKRKYRSPSDLITEVGREKFWRNVQSFAGASVAIGVPSIMLIVLSNCGENISSSQQIVIEVSALITSIGAGVAGFYMGIKGGEEVNKITAIQREIKRLSYASILK